jgi:hypothetical protein
MIQKRAGPEGLDKKTSKFGLNELMPRIETQIIVECPHFMFFDDHDELYRIKK